MQYQQSFSGSFEQWRKTDPSINFFEKKSTVIKFVNHGTVNKRKVDKKNLRY